MPFLVLRRGIHDRLKPNVFKGPHADKGFVRCAGTAFEYERRPVHRREANRGWEASERTQGEIDRYAKASARPLRCEAPREAACSASRTPAGRTARRSRRA
jgi:hypothetical protein